LSFGGDKTKLHDEEEDRKKFEERQSFVARQDFQSNGTEARRDERGCVVECFPWSCVTFRF
jgi:hypothetical protein